MKILFITSITIEDLYKTSRLELSEGLKRRGHEVKLVMGKYRVRNELNDEGIFYLPMIGFGKLSTIVFGMFLFFYLPLLLSKQKADVIMIDGNAVWLPFLLTLKLFRTPLILDIRSVPVDKKKSMLFDITICLSNYLVNALTTITPELREVLRDRYRLERKKIGIWSSGVSIEKFSEKLTMNKNIASLRRFNEFILMYHGSYSPTRGIENLINSITKLEKSIRKKVRLLIIGISLQKKEDLLRLCEEMGVKEQVEFIPPVDYEEIHSYIALSDVGIIPLPPDNEWWRVSAPLKTLEYLAMEKPVIATSIPFHKRIFNRGECGVLLNANSPKALANAITYLCSNREKLDRMGKKGREIVENYYTWDDRALEIETFIKTVLAGH